MLKIILVDDHKLFRQSINFMLTKNNVAEVIGEANNGKEFLELLENNKPDIVLMDICMPVMDGIEATKNAVLKYPDIKILALSSLGDELHYHKMVSAGARGFLLKDVDKGELELAITEVSGGGSWFSNELLRRVIFAFNKASQNVNNLTEREIEVLQLVCQGLINEQIAEKLKVSYDTIRKHRSNLLTKTNCSNTAALVMYAIKNKIIEI